MVQTYPRLPRVAELIPELKPSIVIMMHRYPIDCQTLVVIDVVKSFAMNKSGKRLFKKNGKKASFKVLEVGLNTAVLLSRLSRFQVEIRLF